MENQNVVIFLDKIRKLIDLGNIPKAREEIDVMIGMLEKEEARSKGKIEPLHLPDGVDKEAFLPQTALKINEVIHFLNKRFM